jgi:UDP:flavonoid glycosyltransferase YjiC (YdhE family)
MQSYLNSCKQRSITIPQPTGFNMVSENWPEPGRQIWEQIKAGRPDLFFSKKAVFDPAAIKEINYSLGAHVCFPEGRIKEERDPNFKLLHYKYIGGVRKLAERRDRFAKRLSLSNKIFGWGTAASSVDVLKEHNYETSLARPLNLDYQAPSNETPPKRILLIGGMGGLAEVTRIAGLATALHAAKYEVHLACDLNGSSGSLSLPFKVVPITSIPATEAHQAASRGKSVFDLNTLEKSLWEDTRIIRELSPDLIVGDMRQSLSVSTRLTNTPYINIINAQWSPFADLSLELPHNPLASFLPSPIAQLAVSLAAPLGFAAHIAPLNLVRLKYGLPPIDWDIKQVYCFGDYTLYPDVPQLVPTKTLPPTHHYIGPVLWSPQTQLPDWWHHLPDARPIIYLNLGSSGQHQLLAVVLAALGQLPVTVMAATAADIQLESVPANVYLSKYLPGKEAAQRAQLVICNGGNMSTQQALAEGVPVLAITSNLDQLMFARAVATAGAGEVLKEDQVTFAAVKQIAWQIIQDQKYALAAQRFALIYQQMDASLLFPRFIESIFTN